MTSAEAIQMGIGVDNPMGQADETFRALAESERGGLLRLARGILGDYHEAEDMIQESLMRLFQRWDQARNPKSFLYKTLSNLCIDRVRERARRPPEPPEEPPAHDPLLAQEARIAVRAALDSLDASERAAVVLREVQGLSYAEIAEILDATVAEVTNWIHRGKMQLRVLLTPYVRQGEKTW